MNIKAFAFVIAVILCLSVALVACNDGDETNYVVVTDANGEAVTDDNGDVVTAPDTDGDGQPDYIPGESEGTDSDGVGIDIGENTDDVWGDLISPNRK